MNRPAAAPFSGFERRLLARRTRRPDHVVKYIPCANRLSPAVAFDIVHLSDLDGFHPPVFFEPGRRGSQFTPIIRSPGLDRNFGRGENQVRLSQRPFAGIGDHAGRRHIGRVSFRSPGVNPLANHRDFRIAERRVVLELLYPDALLDEPGRHHAPLVAQRRPLFNGPGPWPGVLKCDKRHRRQTLLVMAVLAAPLQNGSDVFGKCDLRRSRLGRHGCDTGHQTGNRESHDRSGHVQMLLHRG